MLMWMALMTGYFVTPDRRYTVAKKSGLWYAWFGEGGSGRKLGAHASYSAARSKCESHALKQAG